MLGEIITAYVSKKPKKKTQCAFKYDTVWLIQLHYIICAQLVEQWIEDRDEASA